MYFDSLSEFLAMGGHGLYVWMSYGIFVLVILWNIFILRSNRKQLLKRAQKTWQREAALNKETANKETGKEPDKDLNQQQNSVEN